MARSVKVATIYGEVQDKHLRTVRSSTWWRPVPRRLSSLGRTLSALVRPWSVAVAG